MRSILVTASLSAFAAFNPILDGSLVAQQRLVPPPGPVATFELKNPTQLVELLWGTVPGRMAKDEILADLVAQATRRYEERTARVIELKEIAQAEGVTLELEDEVAALIEKAATVEFEEFKVYVYAREQDGELAPDVIAMITPTEGSRGTWAEVVKESRDRAAETEFVSAPRDLEVLDHKGTLFAITDESVDAECVWILDAGHQTVLGIGGEAMPAALTVAADDSPVTAPASQIVVHCGTELHVNIRAILDLAEELSSGDMEEVGPVLAALGLNVDAIGLGYDIDNGLFRFNLKLALPDGPKGLLAAMTSSTDTAPHVPMPQPALLQWRGALNISAAFESVGAAMAAAGEEDRFDDSDSPIKMADITKTFAGGMAFGISAPPMGGAVPRMSMAIRLTSAEAFAEFRPKLEEVLEGVEFNNHEYEDVTWTSVDIPNNAAPLIPSFAVMGDVLLLAENPATLKEMIRITQAGEVGPPIDISQAPRPLPAGIGPEAVEPNLMYDVGAIYSMVQNHYMPMIQLGLGMVKQQVGSHGRPIWEVIDMPAAKDVAPWLGVGTGAMAVTEDGIYVSSVSSLGDPLMAAYMTVVAPLGGEMMAIGMDASISQLESAIARKRTETLWSALRTWRASFGSGTQLPRNLGDLLSRGLIDDPDIFLIPGAEDATDLEYEDIDGEIQTFPCSYRYIPDSKIQTQLWRLEFNDESNEVFAWSTSPNDEMATIILFEAKPSPRKSRLVMTSEGKTYVIPEDTFNEIIN